MDFATAVVPGWHTTIFPPYFVAGAIFSGYGDGADADAGRAQDDEARGLHHAAAHRRDVQAGDPDERHGRPRLRHRVLHRALFGQPVRAVRVHQPRVRTAGLGLLDHGGVQRADAAAVLVRAACAARWPSSSSSRCSSTSACGSSASSSSSPRSARVPAVELGDRTRPTSIEIADADRQLRAVLHAVSCCSAGSCP